MIVAAEEMHPKEIKAEKLQKTQATAKVKRAAKKIDYENESDKSSVQNFKKRF